jgi:hypothetical protein
MNREPPEGVKKELRKEVAYGCPISGCGSPYLTWHHFDPPWSVEEHHRAEGMIALCKEHHDQADAGAFTKEQLQVLKQKSQAEYVSGKFNWMRQKLLFTGGGTGIFDPRIVLTIAGKKVIWFTRDDHGNFLLNLEILNSDGKLIFKMEENFWTILESPTDFVCPPSGRKINITYGDQIRFTVEFDDIYLPQFEKRFNVKIREEYKKYFPTTIVNLSFENSTLGVKMVSTKTDLPYGTFKGVWAHPGALGILYQR